MIYPGNYNTTYKLYLSYEYINFLLKDIFFYEFYDLQASCWPIRFKDLDLANQYVCVCVCVCTDAIGLDL